MTIMQQQSLEYKAFEVCYTLFNQKHPIISDIIYAFNATQARSHIRANYAADKVRIKSIIELTAAQVKDLQQAEIAAQEWEKIEDDLQRGIATYPVF